MFTSIQEISMPNNGQRMPHGGDSALQVKFFKAPKHLAEASRVEEKDVFDEQDIREFIQINIPGGDTIVREATPHDKKRFSAKYRAFKLDQNDQLETDLIVLGLTETQRLNCERANVFSVEQLAAVGENGLKAIGIGASNMQVRAKHYLQSQSSATDELDAIKKENSDLKAIVEKLAKTVDELSNASKKKG